MVDSTAPWDGVVYSIHWVVATAGARTAAESERLYSESGPGNVWSLEARQCGPSTASAGDTRLHWGWGWPGPAGTGWPAESHHYSSTWDQLRAARAGVHVTTIHPHTTQTGQGWTCDPGGGCVTTRDGGCVTQSEVWQWLASVRSNVFIIYYTTRSMLLSLYIASEHWARAHNIPQQTIFDIRS